MRIGRDEARARDKQRPDRADRRVFDEPISGRCHHDRVTHKRQATRPVRQALGDAFNQFGGSQHAGLHNICANIGERDIHLRDDGIGWHWPDVEHAQRILRGDGGNGGHCKSAEGRDGFDIRLNACAAAAIRASDDQHTAFVFAHSWPQGAGGVSTGSDKSNSSRKNRFGRDI